MTEIVVRTAHAARPARTSSRFERRRLANGLNLLSVDLPGGRSSPCSVLRVTGQPMSGGRGRATVLAARASLKGRSSRRIELVRTRALGASLQPRRAGTRSRRRDGAGGPADPGPELLAEMVLEPAFPGPRWIACAMSGSTTAPGEPTAAPAEEEFAASIYRGSPYGRPAAHPRDRAALDRDRVERPGRAGSILPGHLIVVVT